MITKSHSAGVTGKSILLASVVTWFLLLAAGCSDTPEKLYPVTGVVTVGGKPMNSGNVQFEMIERGQSGKSYTARGAIDENGHYELRTFGQAGAPAGKHRVWVVPNFAAMPDKIGLGVEQMSPIPRDYMMPTTTELEYEVQPGENEIAVEIPGKQRR